MDYQVWTSDYGDTWTKVDCGDKEAAIREYTKLIKAGKEPLVTVTVPVEHKVVFKEPSEQPKKSAKELYREGVKEPKEVKEHGAEESQSKGDKDTDSKSEGTV